jgi:hypothetical protein
MIMPLSLSTPPPSLKLIIELHPRNAEQLADIADVLAEVLKFGQEHGIPATVASSAGTTDGDAVDEMLPPVSTPAAPAAVSSTPPTTGPRRVRDRTAERRAKREREAAEAAAGGTATKGNGQAADPVVEPDDADPFGDLDAGFLPPGSPEPPPAAATKPPVNPILAKVRTEQGAMDAALTILRCVYDSPDGAKHVKELQKAHKVAKFTDVPLDAAPVLFKTAFALADKLGVALPSGL